MPNPVPLATKEEEERRAWVTAHHESVRIIKECFGDRFSNNEIFDRLKISRRTGYRALGNDERIGKAPGRKAKISDETVQRMITHIEAGGCNNVGNVWKYLAIHYAPDCNPKTVQDAVKRAGAQNPFSNEKVAVLLKEQLNDHDIAPAEEEAAQQVEDNQADEQHMHQMQQARQAQQAEQSQQDDQKRHHQGHHQRQNQQHHNVYDPALQPQNPPDILRAAIAATHDEGILRYVLTEIVNRNPEAMMHAHQLFFQPSFAAQPSNMAPPMAQMALPNSMTTQPTLHNQLQDTQTGTPERGSGKRRLAMCRRCGVEFDRAENTMSSRECLYHKGSPQKINPHAIGALEQAPEAFIWSCCGRNGSSRGCCQAMHTTKKKRKYASKKRSVSTAGLDDVKNGDAGGGDDALDGFNMDNAGSPGAEDEDEHNGDHGDIDDTTLMQADSASPHSAVVGALSSQHMSSYTQALGHHIVGSESGSADVLQMPMQMPGPDAANDTNLDGALHGSRHQPPIVTSQQEGRYHHQHSHQDHQLGMAGIPLSQASNDIYGQLMHDSQHDHGYKDHQQQMGELDRHGISAGGSHDHEMQAHVREAEGQNTMR